MTVNELIAKLSQLDPTLPVYFSYEDYQDMDGYGLSFGVEKSIGKLDLGQIKIKNRWKDIAIVSEY